MLNSCGERSHPCLFPNFRENIYFFIINFVTRFLVEVIKLRKFSPFPFCWKLLLWTSIGFCQKLRHLLINHILFVLWSIEVTEHINRFSINVWRLSLPFIHGIYPTWSVFNFDEVQFNHFFLFWKHLFSDFGVKSKSSLPSPPPQRLWFLSSAFCSFHICPVHALLDLHLSSSFFWVILNVTILKFAVHLNFHVHCSYTEIKFNFECLSYILWPFRTHL